MRSLWFALKNSFKNFLAPNLIYPWLALGVALFTTSPAMGQFTPPSVTVKSGFVLKQNVPLKLTDMFNITRGDDPLLRLISVCIVDENPDWKIEGVDYIDSSLNGRLVKAACMIIEGSMPNITYSGRFENASLVTEKPPGSVISFGPSFFGYTLACPNYPERCDRLPFGSFGFQIFGSSGLTLSLKVSPPCQEIIEGRILDITADSQSSTMSAKFFPNGDFTLEETARACGVDHFNWYQAIENISVPNLEETIKNALAKGISVNEAYLRSALAYLNRNPLDGKCFTS